MTNYRDRILKNQENKKSKRLLLPISEESYTNDAESARYVNAYIKQKTRYIPSIDYNDPSTFAFFGSAEKYYEDSIKNIHNSYPYDGSKAERMEWMLSASYLDLYLFEHEYPKSTGHVIFDRSSDTITNDTHYPTTDNKQYIKFTGGPQKSTVYNAAQNREGNLKIDGTTGNTIEFWLKKDETSWYGSGRKEVVFDITTLDGLNSHQEARLSVELEKPSSATTSPFLFTYRSGSTGAIQTRLGSTSITSASVGDNKWHHYAITAQTSGSSTLYKLYVDGTLDSTSAVSHTLGPVDRALTGSIGALAAANTVGGALGAGKLSGSLDEVRYWKTARNEKQIGRFWYSPVHGGTDSDHTNASLGLYYKFNEGKTSNSFFDKTILDYSGRVNNGEFVGWAATVRSTESGITLSENIPEQNFTETGDPIINPENSVVTSLISTFETKGKSHDINNLASLNNSVPQYFTDEDNGLFVELLQIMSSAFDDIFIKIKNLPKIKDFVFQDFFSESGQYKQARDNNFLLGCEDIHVDKFTGSHSKPWVNHILEHFGMVTSDIFQDANLFEKFFDRTEEITFEHDLEEVKRLILTNIHKNLVHIMKIKGTEESFRNLIRCFGIDEEVVKLTAYSENEEYELIAKPLYSTIKNKSLSFEGPNYLGTVHQTAADADSRSYISGSTAVTPFTMEGNFVFPKYRSSGSVALTESSLFGMHSVLGSQDAGTPLTWHTEDSASFQVKTVKRVFDEPNAYFELTSSAGVITAITSSYFADVYDNSHWNISVRVGTKSDIDFNIIDSSEYLVEFTGFNYELDVLKNTFHVTASIAKADYEKISNQNKAVFLGSHKTNFTGSSISSADTRALGFSVWKDALNESELKEHAQNSETYGREKPQSISNFDTGDNLLSGDSLILRWQFQNLTSSNASNQLSVSDLSSGSFGSISSDGTVGVKHPGLSILLPDREGAIQQEFLPGVRYHGIDNSYSSDRVKIKKQEIDKFTPSSKPITHTFLFEKSMYQVVSQEMVNFFAGVVGYSNLIGEPVNKYRRKYKLLEKAKEKFFRKVSNDPDLDKFVEYYKWIDSSLSGFLAQIIPASSFLDSDIREVVESHILERNKYEHKAPTIEFKDPADKDFPILSVNELLYDWKHGNGFEAGSDEKCLWRKDREEVSSARQEIRKVLTTEVSGSTYVRRNLTKPYRILAQNRFSTSTGRNTKANSLQTSDEIVNSGLRVPNTSLATEIREKTVCKDNVNPSTKITYSGKVNILQEFDNTVQSLQITNASNFVNFGDEVLWTPYTDFTFGGNYFANPRGVIWSFYMKLEDTSIDNILVEKVDEYTIKALTGGHLFVRFGKSVNNITIQKNSAFEQDRWYHVLIHEQKHTGAAFDASSLVAYIDGQLITSMDTRAENGTYVGLIQGDGGHSAFDDTDEDLTAAKGKLKMIDLVYAVNGDEDASSRFINKANNIGFFRRVDSRTGIPVRVDYISELQGAGNEMPLLTGGATESTDRMLAYWPMDGSYYADGANGVQDRIDSRHGAASSAGTANLQLDSPYRPMSKVVEHSDTSAYLAADSALILPFTLVSSSAGNDFPNVKHNLKISNNHLKLDITGEKPLQGPFSETHLGAKPHNKVAFGTADSNRPEAYVLSAPGNILNLSQVGTHTPKSMFFRHNAGTSMTNIANLKYDTGSLVLGNYRKNYEIVLTNGRRTNNTYLTDTQGTWMNNRFTHPFHLTGAVDFEVQSRTRSSHVIANKFSAPGSREAGNNSLDKESAEMSVYNSINYRNTVVRNILHQSSSEYNEKFGTTAGSIASAAEINIEFIFANFSDITVGDKVEFKTTDGTQITATVHGSDTTTTDTNAPTFAPGINALNTAYNLARSLNPNSKLKAVSDGLNVTLTQIEPGRAGNHEITVTGDTAGAVRTFLTNSPQLHFSGGQDLQGSFHKVNRNPLRFVSAGDHIAGPHGKLVKHDNFFVHHPIPQHDFGYSWISASATDNIYDFLKKNENMGHQHMFSTGTLKSSQTINFVETSELVPNLNFVYGNFYATASLNTATNTVTYSNTALNSQILNTQGPYGWPTWKQIRGYESPVSRNEMRNAQHSIVVGKTPIREGRTGPITSYRTSSLSANSNFQRYVWSTNPNLQDLDFIGTIETEKAVQKFSEVPTTNRFNPLTITFHGSDALDITTAPITQRRHEAFWNMDETSLVSFGENAQRLSDIQGTNTRLGSVKLTFGNDQTLFSNLNLTKMLGLRDVKENSFIKSTMRELGLMRERNDLITEINYIETLYPREVNTFTNESRIRDRFDFYQWKDNRSDRIILGLSGSNFYHTNASSPPNTPIQAVVNNIKGSGVDHKVFFLRKVTVEKDNNKTTNGLFVDVLEQNRSYNLSSSANMTYVAPIKYIPTSRWALDSRSDFSNLPIQIAGTGSSMGWHSYTPSNSSAGDWAQKRGNKSGVSTNVEMRPFDAGLFQNDYSIFALGYNALHGTPPVAPIYNRRIPQIYGPAEFLAGESRYLTAQQVGSSPFSGSFEDHSQNYRQLGQDHSLVPEFIVSDHIEDMVLSNESFSTFEDREGLLTVTGSIYNKSSKTLQVSENFYKTYGLTDMMKYFGITAEAAKTNRLGDPLKITLRCKAAMKFTPYEGFYPAERVKQITEIFSRGYMPDFSFESIDTVPADVLDQEEVLRKKVRANLQQAIKPLFGPGVLMNSIKSGMAVDYPLFSDDNTAVQEINGSFIIDDPREVSSSFGAALALYENTLFVGSPDDNSFSSDEGRGVIYEKRAGEWIQTHALPDPVLGSNDGFGFSAAMDSGSLVIGCGPDSTDERVYAFKRTLNNEGTHMSFTGSSAQIISPSALNVDSNFGQSKDSISVMGDYLVVGAHKSGSNDQGAVYRYRIGSAGGTTQWVSASNQPVLTSSVQVGGLEDEYYGYSLQLHKNPNTNVTELFVGAPMFHNAGSQTLYDRGGHVYYYTESAETRNFVLVQTIVPSITQKGQYFGWSLSAHENTLAVGSTRTGTRNSREGAVFVFQRNTDGLFEEKQQLFSHDRKQNAFFGGKVKVSGSYILAASDVLATSTLEDPVTMYKTSDFQTWNFFGEPAKDITLVNGFHFHYDKGRDLEIDEHQAFVGMPDLFGYDLGDGSTSRRGAVGVYDIDNAVTRHNKTKRTITFPTASFHPDLTMLNDFTGSYVNKSQDSGIPRLSGSAYKRVTFEDMLNPEVLVGTKIHDQEPHPSASIYYADKFVGKVMDFPFKFGKLDKQNNLTDLGVSGFALNKDLKSTLKPYRLAINNFCAETINFFLQRGETATLETFGVVNPTLQANKTYKMRIQLNNSNTQMYDRHSAFGPPVDEGTIKLKSSDGETFVEVKDSHAHSPFVPPFLDRDSNPYVDISFRPTETKRYGLQEILQSSEYEYYNFDVAPNNINGPLTNTNYVHAMSISASLSLNSFAVYEDDTTQQGDEFRQRWVIQPRWETPVLNFSNTPASALNLNGNTVTNVSLGKISTPWQKRNWHNFYDTQPAASSIPYLTTSVGMWHQSGALPVSAGDGYSIVIDPYPDLPDDEQLAKKVGFIKDYGRSVRVGQLAEKKVVSEAVIAIPFIEPEESDQPIEYFKIPLSIRQEATDFNNDLLNNFKSRVTGIPKTEQTYIEYFNKYNSDYNTPGSSAKESVAYQMRMFEKFVIPQQFRDKMMYVFQFSAEFTKEDLAKMWQNTSPGSDLSRANLSYSSVSNGEHVQYISSFLEARHSPTGGQVFFENDKIRWVVFKAKQRAKYDLTQVKVNSLRASVANLEIDDTIGTFTPSDDVREVDYSYNWPYDFFSIVELIKMEGKIDIFAGVSAARDEEE
jgi:hypothetical protein